MITTQIHNTVTPELRDEWIKIWSTHPALATAFNHPVWLEAAESSLGRQDATIVTVRRMGQLVSIAMFSRVRMYGIDVMAPVAIEFADKPTIFIDWTRQELVNALVEACTRLGTVYLPELSDTMRSALARASRSSVTYEDDQNSIVSLVDSPHGELSRDSYAKIIKRVNRSEQPVSMTYCTTDHISCLKKTYEVERQSTKTARGMGVLSRAPVQKFFEYISTHTPELVDISIMNIGDTPIAFSIDFLAHGIYQGSQKAYTKGYEYYQPGKYLVMKLLEHNHELGRRAFDFGRGYDNFKMQFTKNAHPLYTVIISRHKFIASYLAGVRHIRHKVYNTMVTQRRLYSVYKTLTGLISK